MRYFFKIFIDVFLLILLNVACGKYQHVQHESLNDQTKARRLINKGEVDAALNYYEKIIQDINSPDSAKIEYASALAFKAGINVYSLFPILQMKLFNKPLSENGKKSSENSNDSYSSIEKILTQNLKDKNKKIAMSDEDQQQLKKQIKSLLFAYSLSKNLWKFYQYYTTFTLIPYVKKENRSMVHNAIDYLSHVKFHSSRSAHIAKSYSFYLAAIIAASYLKDIFSQMQMDHLEDYVCLTDIDELDFNVTQLKKNIDFMKKNSLKKNTTKDLHSLSLSLNKIIHFFNSEKLRPSDVIPMLQETLCSNK